MPTITAITLQKRDTSRCNISIDGQFAFTLTSLEVSELDLRPGQVIADERLLELKDQAVRSKAYDSALRLVMVRRRSAHELAGLLVRKGYSAEEASAVVARLTNSGLVNDLEFARAWVADRMALRPRSQRQLEQELTQKGVSQAVRESVLAEYADSDEIQAVSVAAKKYRTGRYDEQKLLAFLSRQGYGYEVARAAVQKVINED